MAAVSECCKKRMMAMIKKAMLTLVHGGFLLATLCRGACDHTQKVSDDGGTDRALGMAAEVIAGMHDLTVAFEQKPQHILLKRERKSGHVRRKHVPVVHDGHNSAVRSGCALLTGDEGEHNGQRDYVKQVADLLGTAQEVQLKGRTCFVLTANNQAHLSLGMQELAHYVCMLQKQTDETVGHAIEFKKQSDASVAHADASLQIAQRLFEKNKMLQEQLDESNRTLQEQRADIVKALEKCEQVQSFQSTRSEVERLRVEGVLAQVIEQRDEYEHERDRYKRLLSGLMRTCVMQRREVKTYQMLEEIRRQEQVQQQQEGEGEQNNARECAGDSGEEGFLVVTSEQGVGE